MRRQNQKGYGGDENDFHYNVITGLVLGIENILLKGSFMVFLIVISYIMNSKKVRRYNPVSCLVKNQKSI